VLRRCGDEAIAATNDSRVGEGADSCSACSSSARERDSASAAMSPGAVGHDRAFDCAAGQRQFGGRSLSLPTILG